MVCRDGASPSVLVFPHSAALMNLHDSFSSPHALKSFVLGTHTHLKFIKTESPRKLRHRPPFLCTEPNRSKHCLLLLINSVSFQQESMLFLCHRLTHTLAHIDSQKCSSFQLMISGRIHCSGELWSGLPASRKQGKVWQSFSWKNPLRDQHEA